MRMLSVRIRNYMVLLVDGGYQCVTLESWLLLLTYALKQIFAESLLCAKPMLDQGILEHTTLTLYLTSWSLRIIRDNRHYQ